MELNLLPVLNYEGKRMPIDLSFDAAELSEGGIKILSPVVVKGEFANIGGSIELNACGNAELELLCDRCAESFISQISFEIKERFRKEENNAGENENPDVIIIDGNVVDMNEIVYDSLALSIPTKLLCSEDCEGLCPVCGINLNSEKCSCKDEQTDPRFDILDKLL